MEAVVRARVGGALLPRVVVLGNFISGSPDWRVGSEMMWDDGHGIGYIDICCDFAAKSCDGGCEQEPRGPEGAGEKGRALRETEPYFMTSTAAM
jgi:hypothetical protein